MENGQQISDFANLHDQIYHADCMELMAHIPNGFVSLILTDPPYGISYQNHFTRKKHQILEGDTGIDYERFAWESYRILADNAHAYFFTRFDCYPYHYDCLKQAGFQIKNCLGKTIFEQQGLLYQALLEWLDTFESQFKES